MAIKTTLICVFTATFLATAAHAQPAPASPPPQAAATATATATAAPAAPSPAMTGAAGEQPKTETPEKPPKNKVVTVAPKTDAGKKKVKTMFALFDTTMGKFKCKLFVDEAPKAVDNFVGLAEGTKEYKDPATYEKKKSHFYDGLTFHRIIKKFMIQGGDPEGTGMGGPGYEFPDEKNQNLNFDKGGMLAMANRGPNTNGSQFFVTTDPAAWLNGNYTIFGEVVEGMDVVKKISETPTDKTNDRPLKPVKLNKVTIIRK